MARIRTAIIGAFLCGVLLSLGQSYSWAMIFAPFCFGGMCIIIEKGSKASSFVSVLIFIFSYLIFHTAFIWNTDDKNGLEVLYCIFPFVCYAIPQLSLLFVTKYKSLIFVTGWLMSELVFVRLELGTTIYQLGNIWANFPSLIQWYEYFGIFSGSVWMVLMGYGFYQAVVRRRFALFFIGSLIPIFFSIALLFTHSQSVVDRTALVANLSLRKGYKKYEIDSIIHANRFRSVDFIILPEAIGSYRLQNYRYAPFMTSIKRNLTDSLTNASAIIGLWLKDNKDKYYNVVVDYSRQGEHIRYKERRMPFGEFLPYSRFFGRFDFFSKLICNSSLNSMYIERAATNILRASALVLRRSIVRSVDNGLPCFIAPTGGIKTLPVYSTAYITQPVDLLSTVTFYAKNHKQIMRLVGLNVKSMIRRG